MTLGIITTAIFILVSTVSLTQKKSTNSKIKKLSVLVHKPLGYLFVALSIIHLMLTLHLIKQRPIIIYILGLSMVICSIGAIITLTLIKNRHKSLTYHKSLALIISFLLISHISFCFVSLNKYKHDVTNISFSNPNIYSITDGMYIGDCDVGYIYAKVRVTVSNGIIANIDLLEHLNERGKAGEKVITKILAAQRIDIDDISSATYSSKVIRKAIENSLEND